MGTCTKTRVPRARVGSGGMERRVVHGREILGRSPQVWVVSRKRSERFTHTRGGGWQCQGRRREETVRRSCRADAPLSRRGADIGREVEGAGLELGGAIRADRGHARVTESQVAADSAAEITQGERME